MEKLIQKKNKDYFGSPPTAKECMAVLHCISVIFVCPKSIFFLGLNIFLLFLSLFLVLLKKKFLVFLFSSPPERRRIAAPYLHANFVIFQQFLFLFYFFGLFLIYIYFSLSRKAKECSAVSQCIQAWHGLSLPADKDGICTLCMEMIEDAEDFIASNNTEVCATLDIKIF